MSVGISGRKKDGLALATGKPAYTADLAPGDALVVKVLRSPHAHARILSIDASEALKVPGVECILTHQDLPDTRITRAGQSWPEPSPRDKRVLEDRVRYVGDDVAIVGARSQQAAQDALDRIQVEYEELEAVTDFEKALDNPVLVHPEADVSTLVETGFDAGRNLVAEVDEGYGDVGKELASSAVILDETYYTPAQAHAMMEPYASSARLDLQGRLEITSSTQIPFHVRRSLGEAFGLPLSRIRVIKPRVGGGFGGKQTMAGELYVAAVTLATGKPSAMVFTRKETFTSTTCRHPMRIRVRLGAGPGGDLRAVDLEVLSDTGAYGEHAPTVLLAGGFKGLPIYSKARAMGYRGQAVYTNLRPSGAMRGYGVTQICFALESAMDELAGRLGMDPLELRRKNMIATGDNYNPLGSPEQARALRSCALPWCLEEGIRLSGWDQGQKTESGGKLVGLGMALSMQGSGLSGLDMGSARIKLNDSGFFNLLVGATDIGTGSDTILSQMAAEVLEVPLEQVIPYSSDTDLTPFDSGAYASSTTYVSGTAVVRAASSLKEQILAAGAEILGLPEHEAFYRDGAVRSRDGEQVLPLAKLAEMLTYRRDLRQLEGSGSFTGEESPPPFVAAFARVEVDPETGKTDLTDYLLLLDCGVLINPALARIQAEGGSVQGIGLGLFEQAKTDERGRLMTDSFLSYKIPCRSDLPVIRTVFADSMEPSGPFGAKSIGEVVINPAAPAIANAVAAATGIRFRDLPITPEKVLMALLKKENNRPGAGQEDTDEN